MRMCWSTQPCAIPCFLLDLWNLDAETMATILVQQVGAMKHHGWTIERLLDRLARDAPEFANAVRKSGLVSR